MPLILAVEPDRKQAAKIAAMARGQLRAELVVTASAAGALAVLADRVPDLILTSQLLSPREEAALADRLRELDGAGGARVQTLMIPVLAAPEGMPEAKNGLLSRLRPTRGGYGTPAGCDPAIFSAQIAEYLDRAQEERRVTEDRERDTVRETREADTIELEAAGDREIADPAPVDPALSDLAFADPVPSDPVLADPFLSEAFLSGPVPVTAVAEVAARSSWEDLALDDEEAPIPIELSSESIDLAAFVSELEAESLEADDLEEDVPTVAIEVPVAVVAPRVAFAHALSARPSWPLLEGPHIGDARKNDESGRDVVLEDFIAALTETPRLGEPTGLWEEDEPIGDLDPDGDLWMPLPAVARSNWPPMFGFAPAKDEARPEAARPVPRPAAQVQPLQDEWGFFDPERCGFNALLARLDELSK